MKKEFSINIRGTEVNVSEEVYHAFMRPIYRERESARVWAKRELSYDLLLEEDNDPADPSDPVDKIVEDKLMRELLIKAIDLLSEEERSLIQTLFYEGVSERELASKTGVPRKTIAYRKIKVLEKLKKIMGK